MVLLSTQISVANGRGAGVRYGIHLGYLLLCFCLPGLGWGGGWDGVEVGKDMMLEHADIVAGSQSARGIESGLRCGMQVSRWSMWMIWFRVLVPRIWATFRRRVLLVLVVSSWHRT